MAIKSGYSSVVVGAQYGDEGKARAVDGMADDYGVIARFNGGSNAGHTIKVGNITVFLHQVPSGVFYPDKTLYIGSGCVVHPSKLKAEILEISQAGLSVKGRLHISATATLVQPHHVLIDSMNGGTIATTKQGIGPAYADRATRMMDDRLVNIRAAELLSDFTKLETMVRANLNDAIQQFAFDSIDADSLIAEFMDGCAFIREFVESDALFLVKKIESGINILYEGAQSVMLDVVNGPVPFVTSSCTLAAAAYTGGDLPHIYHRHTIGVVKAIMSRVGNGPFLSEYGGIESEQYCAKTINARAAESTLDTQQLLQSADPLDIAKGLRVRGNEYGATTGRPRRMGALDLVQLRQVIKLNAINGLFLTKADCLQDFSLTQKGTVPIVTAYHLDGAEIDYIPANVDAARRVQVTITEFPAFSQDISAIRHKEELPKELLDILHFIESFTGCPILTIGVGAEREQFVDLI